MHAVSIASYMSWVSAKPTIVGFIKTIRRRLHTLHKRSLHAMHGFGSQSKAAYMWLLIILYNTHGI